MKTQLLLLFSFLFTLFFHGFSYGESSAEFVIQPETLNLINAFTPKIPVRASLLNNIGNTSRIVTELDPFLDREDFIKIIDTFIGELKKD